MESTYSNEIRIGNFTSSEIYKLISEGKQPGTFGKPALTYINECNKERKLKRPLENESNARPLTWGKALESICFAILGTEYELCSQESISHPTINFWAGSPEGNKFDDGKTVYDIKCPMTLSSFCDLVGPLYENFSGSEAIILIRNNHKDGEKYYWQLVSNGILTDSKFAELIVYVPYKKDLDIIRESVSNMDGNQNPYAWINWATDDELPYLIENGYYKDLNIIRFEIPEEDKQLLTSKIIEAGKLLLNL